MKTSPSKSKISSVFRPREESSGSCDCHASGRAPFLASKERTESVNRKRRNIEVQIETSELTYAIYNADSHENYISTMDNPEDGDSFYYSACSDQSVRCDADYVDCNDGDGAESGTEAADSNWTIETLYSSCGVLSFKLRADRGASMVLFVDEILFTLRAITESSKDDVFKVISSSGEVALLTEKEVVAYVSWLVESFNHNPAKSKRKRQLSRKSLERETDKDKKISRKTAHPPLHEKHGRKVQDETVPEVPLPNHVPAMIERRMRRAPLNCMLRFVTNRRQRFLVNDCNAISV